MATDNPVTVGGAYVESEDHVPNVTDITAQYNTSGIGAHQQIEEISPVFEADKAKTSAEVLAALDEDNDAVSGDKVLLPNLLVDNEEAVKQVTRLAKARVKKGVVVGEPGPAEREAELEGDEGTQAAVETERSNAAANSTGARTAGQHDGTVRSEHGKDDTALVSGGPKGTGVSASKTSTGSATSESTTATKGKS